MHVNHHKIIECIWEEIFTIKKKQSPEIESALYIADENSFDIHGETDSEN